MIGTHFSHKKASLNVLANISSVLIPLLLVLHEVTPDHRGLSQESNDTTSTNISDASSPVMYTCPPQCKCDYDVSSLRLDIACSGQDNSYNAPNTSISTVDFDLSQGVRLLILRNLTLNWKSIRKVTPTLVENTLAELELHNVTIEPLVLFNSLLFRASNNSLRRLSIFQSTTEDKEVLPVDYKESLHALATLQNLDSLTICDSYPSLSQIILQALPQVNHVQVIGNSLSQLYYLSFSHLTDLQSLNLSHNHLSLIPNGLLDNLINLQSLDVSNNRITHLQEEVFGGLRSLRKLNASHNKIEYVDAEVFTNLKDLQSIDLSNNEVIQFFEPYFKHNADLRILKMSNTWVTKTFINENTAPRSYREMDTLISTLQNVEILDISDNEMTVIPETLSHVLRLSHAYLQGNPWNCNCEDRWLLDWISTSNVSLDKDHSAEDLYCISKPDENRSPLLPYLQNLTQYCNNSNIIARTPFRYFATMGEDDKVLRCHNRKPPWPKITWVTPSKTYLFNNNYSTSVFKNKQEESSNPTVQSDGALHIEKVHGSDYGQYLCIASYEDLNITHYVHLGMDVSIFSDVWFWSIVCGLITSFGFLFIVLLVQGIHELLIRCGVKCIVVRTANQTRRVRAFFDSLEQHKSSQLDWLRQNYHMQAKKIQDNCISQLERIRESYTNQTKNLSEFREYSAQQLVTLRDQYHDQIRKVASYSAHRLGRVRENYVFNRNRVCKFSSHQLIRLREAYKWQAQTLNKILENLPQGLSLDACRGVAGCGHAESIYLDDVGGEFGDDPLNLLSMRHGRGDGLLDKPEHISLLNPPEFLAPYLNFSFENPEEIAPSLTVDIELSPKAEVDNEMGDSNEIGDSNLNETEPRCDTPSKLLKRTEIDADVHTTSEEQV